MHSVLVLNDYHASFCDCCIESPRAESYRRLLLYDRMMPNGRTKAPPSENASSTLRAPAATGTLKSVRRDYGCGFVLLHDDSGTDQLILLISPPSNIAAPRPLRGKVRYCTQDAGEMCLQRQRHSTPALSRCCVPGQRRGGSIDLARRRRAASRHEGHCFASLDCTLVASRLATTLGALPNSVLQILGSRQLSQHRAARRGGERPPSATEELRASGR